MASEITPKEPSGDKAKRSSRSMRRMQSERKVGSDGKRKTVRSAKSERHLLKSSGGSEEDMKKDGGTTTNSESEDLASSDDGLSPTKKTRDPNKSRRSKMKREKSKRISTRNLVLNPGSGHKSESDDGGEASPRKHRRSKKKSDDEHGTDKKPSSRKAKEYLQFDPTKLGAATVAVDGEEADTEPNNKEVKEDCKEESGKDCDNYLQFDPTNLNNNTAAEPVTKKPSSSKRDKKKDKKEKHKSSSRRSSGDDSDGFDHEHIGELPSKSSSKSKKKRPGLTRAHSTSHAHANSSLSRGGRILSKSHLPTASASTRNLSSKKASYGQMMDDDDDDDAAAAAIPPSEPVRSETEEFDQFLKDFRSSKDKKGSSAPPSRKLPKKARSSGSLLMMQEVEDTMFGNFAEAP
eukprot:CAMPEP_0172453936 /NCGR_PEP_ID=MMETSP1065-20121228/11069_1 /TAXON_ID=265537 /ORGANISM="Amphiprora paludosa, Strain CCMP125" /LENGTH=404 /DNA_ID=CAMNT_0013206185 /DNA_START=33 /DNA_END=1247 /DNA_ORIENTATION=+